MIQENGNTDHEEKELEGREELATHDSVAVENKEREALEKTLSEERAKAEEYLAGWQRAQADFINLKRRTEQEKEETTRFANTTLILNLLPVLDDMNRAISAIPPNAVETAWVDGIRLIYRNFRTVMENMGVSEIKVVGEKFDPNLHQAMMEGEGEAGIVVKELQKGYKLHHRVIKPSLVVVGKSDEKQRETESTGKE